MNIPLLKHFRKLAVKSQSTINEYAQETLNAFNEIDTELSFISAAHLCVDENGNLSQWEEI